MKNLLFAFIFASAYTLIVWMANWPVGWLISDYKKRYKEKKKNDWGGKKEELEMRFKIQDYTTMVGFLETFMYVSAVLIKVPGIIAVWLGLKVGSLLVKEFGSKEDFETQRVLDNIFLIGNLLTVIMGVLVGILIRGFLESRGVALPTIGRFN